MSYLLVEQLKKHEGFRGTPYLDTTGNLTIGYGRNLTANPLTEDEASFLLTQDIHRHTIELAQAYPVVQEISAVRHDALINMAFNLGLPRLQKFRRMWSAITFRDWDQAAKEALDSKWAKQVGSRANDIAYMLRTGKYPESNYEGDQNA